MELPQCLGHEFLQEFAQLNRVAVAEIENLEFLFLKPLAIRRENLEIIEPIHNKVFILVNQQIVDNLAHIIIQEIDLFLALIKFIRTCKSVYKVELFQLLPCGLLFLCRLVYQFFECLLLLLHECAVE